MSFVTDKQTLDDLGIFGKPGNDSVFSLFNRCCTAGGAAILEEMFAHPLSDALAINQRLSIIRELAVLKINFPFQAEQFALVEHYLQNTDERTRLSPGQNTLGKKLFQLIDTDAEYRLLVKGATALREILADTRNFLQSVSLDGITWFIREKNTILALLGEDPFKTLVLRKKNESIGATLIAEYDTLFRFRKRPFVKQVLQFIYQLDVYISVAKVAAEWSFCFPEAMTGNNAALQIHQAWHPLLKDPVANTINISHDKNMVFLTGANMAGKSTFMKTLGICVFLAHMGFPVPAANMQFPVMGGLYTTINLPDNLGMGTSHFYAEVLRVKKVAKELGVSRNLFVIFDELFRGTNVKDAYEATIAIITAFAKKQSSMFVVSTHWRNDAPTSASCTCPLK
jgi:DNA mismatch repair ATPase MutS